MTDDARPRLAPLSALAQELRRELEEALRSDRTTLVDQLRGELALLEDLALPEAISELRLQHLAYEATATAMRRPLPAGLVRFLG